MTTKTTIAIVALLVGAIAIADDTLQSTYETIVDESGNISLPDDFRRDWAFLGTWSIAKEDVETSSAASGHGAAGLHNVYTQRATIEHFRETGEFPDGAVIIKELLKAETASMTTGTVSRGTEVEGWFVMVKDAQGRFPSNPLWGDGWGWSLFGADQPDSTVTTNYKTECIGCHIPARSDDWIYLDGYPVLDAAR
ncbi:MAG: cytochrome P460 family protein [Woeseiaceae bacterium]